MKTALHPVLLAILSLGVAGCSSMTAEVPPESHGGLFGSAAGLPTGLGTDGGLYAYNGRCDDPRYRISNGGRAQPGTDQYDCSRYGGGL